MREKLGRFPVSVGGLKEGEGETSLGIISPSPYSSFIQQSFWGEKRKIIEAAGAVYAGYTGKSSMLIMSLFVIIRCFLVSYRTRNIV